MPPHYGRRMQTKRLTEEIDSGADSLFGEVEKEITKETTSSKDEPVDTKTSDSILESKTKIEIESEEREKEKKDKFTKSNDLFDEDTVEDKAADIKEEAPSKSPEMQVRPPTPEVTADKEKEAPPH